MDFKDISARLRQVKEQEAASANPDKLYDSAESYRLRAKMLGVLIQNARVAAARTIEDCARLLNVTPQIIQAWEYGEQAPSLPQLELLAYYLDVPVSHFWGQETIDNERAGKADAQSEYLQLRQRMIGALLRQAREEAGLTLEQVAEATYLPQSDLAQYEAGGIAVPMHQLTVLANAVNKNVSFFLETSSYIGELLQMRELWKQFKSLDEDMRAFAASPVNLGFIRIAMMFSQMPAEQLRKVAEGMLEITM